MTGLMETGGDTTGARYARRRVSGSTFAQMARDPAIAIALGIGQFAVTSSGARMYQDTPTTRLLRWLGCTLPWLGLWRVIPMRRRPTLLGTRRGRDYQIRAKPRVPSLHYSHGALGFQLVDDASGPLRGYAARLRDLYWCEFVLESPVVADLDAMGRMLDRVFVDRPKSVLDAYDDPAVLRAGMAFGTGEGAGCKAEPWSFANATPAKPRLPESSTVWGEL